MSTFVAGMGSHSVKVGDIIYPSFDGFWRKNQHLGSPAWRPIELYPSREGKPDEFVVRVHREVESTFPDYDNRMAGRLTSGGPRIGLVCIVKGAKLGEHFATREQKGWPTGYEKTPREYEARLMLLDPPDDIWGLKVTSIREKVIFAEPHRLEKLP